MSEKNVFVVAVSGGVDSVVLLHKIAEQAKKKSDSNKTSYVVAHFQHGIRDDAEDDAVFVQKIASSYGFTCEIGHGKLGKDASEAAARQARYNFLRKTAQHYEAEKIITAHHEDDLLETMVINIIRGSGPRGLVPMTQPDVLRPFLHKSKQDLIEYARSHNLEWREDSTNEDETYLRNYVRKKLMPRLAARREELLQLHRRCEELYHELDMRLGVVLPKKNVLHRSSFLRLGWKLQTEFIRAWLLRFGVNDLEKDTIERIALAAKTLPVGKKVDINHHLWLKSEQKNVLLSSK